MVSTWPAGIMLGDRLLMTGAWSGSASTDLDWTGRFDVKASVSWITTTDTWIAVLGR